MSDVPSADEFESLLGEFDEDDGEQDDEDEQSDDEDQTITVDAQAFDQALREAELSGGDVRRNVNESADKIQLETQIKRGEATRDEDRIKVKVKGDHPEQTAQKLHQTVVAIGSQGTVNALRGTQPSGGQDDG